MTRKKESLKKYHSKRDFSKTPEPMGDGSVTHHHPIFVIHQHAASHMHYDLRLEADGVLKSWAIPKGPSMNPQDKRLAIPTEDHPMGYAGFEGVIPEGNYGAGPVIVWDRGTYENLKPYSMDECLDKGECVIELHGHKLKGKFALIRTNYLNKKSWIFLKMKDEEADGRKNILLQDESVKSHKTIENLSKKK